MPNTTRFSIHDLVSASLNQQEFEKGTSIVRADVNLVFFIYAIDNASHSNPVTILDASGNAYTVIYSDRSTIPPYRLPKGFTVQATEDVVVRFFSIYGD